MNRADVLADLAARRITPAEARTLLAEDRHTSVHASGAPSGETPIAVVGMAGRYAGAGSLDELWTALVDGQDLVGPVPADRWSPPAGHPGVPRMGVLADAANFDSLFFEVAPAEADVLDPQQRLVLEQGFRAFTDAGWSRAVLDGTNCGIYVGMANDDFASVLRTAGVRAGVTAVNNAVAAGRLAYFFNTKGPALTVDTACSSSLVAVHLAAEALRHGEIDLALAVGVSLYLTWDSYAQMEDAGMLSADGHCRSFDDAADGFVPGEGAGALVLRRLPDAVAAGDRILGVLRASGVNSDGRTNGLTAPSLASQASLVRDVYSRFGIDAASIGFAELHGTGTRLGDPIELQALADAYADWAVPLGNCVIGSVKSNIGHMSAAAGIVGLQKALLCLRHRQLVPSLHVDTPNRHFDFAASPFRIGTEVRPWEADGPRRASVSSFGVSGTNAHVVVDEYPDVTPRVPARPGPVLYVLSGRCAEQLARWAGRLADWATAAGQAELDLLEQTLWTGYDAWRERAAIVASGRDELVEGLRALARGADRPGRLWLGSPTREQIRLGEAQPAVRVDDDPVAAGQAWVAGRRLEPTPFAPGRTRLPEYPLVGQRHWPQGADVAGPTLEARGPEPEASEDGDLVISETDPLLSAHVVDETPVVAAAHLLALVDARLGDASPVGYRDLAFLTPLRPDPGQEVRARLITAGNPGESGFEVWSGGDLVAVGRQDRCDRPADLAIPAAARAGAAWHYPAGTRVRYDEPFRTLRSLAFDAGAAWALLETSGTPARRLDAGLLDGAFQAAGVLAAERGLTGVLPAGCAELAVSRPWPARCWARVQLRPSGRDAGAATADISIVDEDGVGLATVAGLRLVGAVETPLVYLAPRWRPVDALAVGQGPAFVCGGLDEPSRTLADALRAGLPDAHLLLPGATEGPGLPFDPVSADAWAGAFTAAGGIETLVLVGSDGGAEANLAVVHAAAQGLLRAGVAGRVARLAYLHRAAGRDPEPDHEAVAGYLRSLVVEEPRLACLVGGVDPDTDPAGVLSVSAPSGTVTKVRLEATASWREELVEVSPSGTTTLRGDGVYLVTGAQGALGKALAGRLAADCPEARLVLTGRRPAAADASAGVGAADRLLYVPCELSDGAQVAELIHRARRRWGRIDGVLHCAGQTRDALVPNLSGADLAAVLDAKCAGTRHLDAALGDSPLDWFALFSSMTALLGNAGQAAYGAANAYLDAYATRREARRAAGDCHGTTVSIGWPLWADGGMRIAPEAADDMRRHRGMEALGFEAGWHALLTALAAGEPRITCVPGDPARIRSAFAVAPAPAEASAPVAAREPVRTGPASALVAGVTGWLVDLVADQLRIPAERVDSTEDLSAFGIDSIVMVSITRQLERVCGPLPKTLFFEHTTLASLAAWLVGERPAELAAEFGGAAEAAPARVASPVQADLPVRAVPGPGVAVRASGQRPTAIAIVGVSGRYPAAPDLAEFWANLRAGRDCITTVPAERWEHRRYLGPVGAVGRTYGRWGGFIDGVDRFDPMFFGISPREAEFLDPQCRLFLEESWHALEDAGYTRAALAEETVGVFVGAMYAQHELFRGRAGDVTTPAASSFAAIANRVSYTLNLTGPSIALDTMCSSSLTAIHLASESLRSGECTVAIAGGVNVTVHPNKYIQLAMGRMLASDGRCRSFGAGGDGYVPSEGVGAVLLKRLDRAEQDGDHVHGVILASATNAGGRTTGFTVPSPAAQTRLTHTTLARAGVAANTVSYVEAHGTGTALGDPIEIRALTDAFRSGDPASSSGPAGRCAIGSVKSGIGHCESAAGIAGLTKVLLQLRHGELVPSLHSATLNPNLDLQDGPFVVQQATAPWRRPVVSVDGIVQEVPRRALVSAFGAGGANAQLLVQEYLPRPSTAACPESADRVFCFSAATPERLRLVVQRFCAATEGGGLDPADVAFTLQVGREALAERVAVVASSLADVRRALDHFLGGRPHSGLVTAGAGGRRPAPRVLEALAASDAVARLAADGDLLRVAGLWVDGVTVDWAALPGVRGRRVPLPGYPFAREVCRLLTVDELAANLAGEVTAAEPGLTHRIELTADHPLVAGHRVLGRPTLPAAASLSLVVGLIREHGLGDPEVALTFFDVAWPVALTVDDPVVVELRLDPADEGFAFTVATGTAGARRTHCLGNVALGGRLDGPGEAWPEPGVDGEPHGVDAAYAGAASIGLDYGLDYRVLSEIRTVPGSVAATLGRPDDPDPDEDLPPTLLDGVFQTSLFMGDGGDAAGLRLPFALDRLRLHRPLMPGSRVMCRERGASQGALRRIDVQVRDDAGLVLTGSGLAYRAAAPSRSAGLIYVPRLVECPPSDGPLPASRALAVLCGRLGAASAEVGRSLDGDVHAAATDPLAGAAGYPATIVDLAGAAGYPATIVDLAGLVAQVRPRDPRERLFLQLVTVAPDEAGPGDPPALGLAAFGAVVGLEHPEIGVQVVAVPPDVAPADLAAILAAERCGSPAAYVVHSHGRRLERDWEAARDAPAFDWPAGTYLITGGARGVGALVARRIARRCPTARLVLVGRSARDRDTDALLADLGAAGSAAEYAQVDLQDAGAVAALVDRLTASGGTLAGVVHCAGERRDGLLHGKTTADVAAVLAGKTTGVENLDAATAGLDLALFVAFGSLAGIIGNVGQADYAAANGYLAAWGARRADQVTAGRRAGRTLVIDWPLWAAGGMAVGPVTQRTADAGLVPLDPELALDLLEASLATGEPETLPVGDDAARVLALVQTRSRLSWTGASAAPATAVPGDAPGETESGPASVLDLLRTTLSRHTRLDRDRVDPDAPLETFGLDSVVIVEITDDLSASLGPLPRTLFFDCATLREVAEFLVARGSSAPARPEAVSPAVVPRRVAPVPVPASVGPGSVSEPPSPDGIAIIGLSGRYPGSPTLTTFWQHLVAADDCVTEIPADRWDHAPFFEEGSTRRDRTGAKWGGFIDDPTCFDSLLFGISPGEAACLDPQERQFLEVSYAAIQDAGYTRESLRTGADGQDRPVGVFVGVMYDEYQLWAAQSQARGEMITLGGVTASVANRVSYACGFHGPSVALNTMCSSSLVALHQACQSLLADESAVALAGGVNLLLHPNKFLMLGQNHYVSPTGRCASFGAGADGYVPAEGVGVLVLKRLRDALADGDHVYGLVLGSAINHGGKTNGYSVPSPQAQSRVIRQALRCSAIDPAEVSYVEAHGTGTRVGDPIEVESLAAAYGLGAPGGTRYVGSVKSNIGHCESAAGVAGVTKVLLQFAHGVIAPSIHSAVLNPDIDFPASGFEVPQRAIPWTPPGRRVAGVSAFGAGGTNAHVVLGERAPEPSAPGRLPVGIVLSARKEEQVRAMASDLLDWCGDRALDAAELTDLAYTLQVGREPLTERVAFLADSVETLKAGLAAVAAGTGAEYAGRVPGSYRVPTPEVGPDVPLADALRSWVDGARVDWAGRYGGGRHRLSLPTYPFEKRRHWLPDRSACEPMPAGGGVARLHRLVHENRSTLYHQRFVSLFTGRENFLDDHRVGERRVLPGAVTLDMMRVAAEESLGRPVPTLRDVEWLRPIRVGEEPVEVEVEVVPAEDDLVADVRIVGDHDQPVCARAVIDWEPLPSVDRGPVDLVAARARCSGHMTGAETYEAMQASGLVNGPGFRAIDSLALGSGEALADLSAPSADAGWLDPLAPSLVNGAFQAVLGVLATLPQDPRWDGAPVLYLPLSIGTVRIHGALASDCVAIVRAAPDARHGGPLCRFDITITDRAGAPLVTLDDFVVRAIGQWAGTEVAADA